MARLVRGKCAAKVPGWVTLAAPGCYGVAENLAGYAEQPMSQVERTARFDFAQGRQQCRRVDLGDRLIANLGKKIRFESAKHVVGVMRRLD